MRLRHWLLIILIGSIIPYVFSQDSWNNQIKIARSSSPQISEQISALLDLESDLKESDHLDTLGILYYSVAFRYINSGDWLNTKNYCLQAIEAFSQAEYGGYQLANSLSFVAEAEEQLGNILSASEYYNQIIRIDPNGSDRIQRAHCFAAERLAFIYRFLEDYESGIKICDYIIGAFSEDQYSGYLINLHLDASISYVHLLGKEGLDKATHHMKESQRIYEQYGHPSIFKQSEIKEQSAFIKLTSGDYDQAGTLYLEAYESSLSADTSQLGLLQAARNIHNAAETFLAADNPTKALYYGERCLNLIKDLPSSALGDETKLLSFYNLAEIHDALGKKEQVASYASKGLELSSALKLDEARKRYFDCELQYLLLKNQSFQGEALTSKLYLIDSLFSLRVNRQLSDISINKLKEEGAKYYALAAQKTFELNDFSSFHHFAEKAKALKLLEARRLKSVENESIRTMQGKLNEVQYQIVQLELNSHEASTDSLSKLLSQLKVDQIRLLDDLKKSISIDNSIKPLDSKVSGDKTFVQYKFGPDSLYSMVWSEGDMKLYNLGARNELIKQIIQFNSLASTSNSNYQELKSGGALLYEKLIQPLNVSTQELVIIPEEELFLLAFDALINDEQQYLGEVVNISYTPSYSFYHEVLKNKSGVDNKLIILPTYQSDENLVPLRFSNEESLDIKNIINGSIITTVDHQKNNLLDKMSAARVIHFAGHAVSNQEANYLALGSSDTPGDRIYQEEIYVNPIDADLVTLSACNTGQGQILKGEGIASLARAFLYGGSRSVISTLWSVDDQSTSIILKGFYNHLQSGLTQSEALYQAKQDYIMSAESYAKHPYYWAGITLMGASSDDQSINVKFYWVALGAVIITLISLLGGRSFFSNHK